MLPGMGVRVTSVRHGLKWEPTLMPKISIASWRRNHMTMHCQGATAQWIAIRLYGNSLVYRREAYNVHMQELRLAVLGIGVDVSPLINSLRDFMHDHPTQNQN